MSGAPWVVTFSWQPHVSAQQEGDLRPPFEVPVMLDGLVGRIAVDDGIVRQRSALALGDVLDHESAGLAVDLARIVDGRTVEGYLTYPEKMAIAAGYALNVAGARR